MFDLRYHVASLAAVFIALIIGILVGVGLAGSGVTKDAELKKVQLENAGLNADVNAKQAQIDSLQRTQKAFQLAYPALMANRLAGKRVAILFIGPVDSSVGNAIEKTLTDGGALPQLRMRAISVPIDSQALDTTLFAQRAFVKYVGDDKLGLLGRALASEFTLGGATPLWTLLSSQLVEERSGPPPPLKPADAVVVVRTVKPQQGVTARFLDGLLGGLGVGGTPVIAVEKTAAQPSAVPAFTKRNIAIVDDIDQPVGRLALALLLNGAPTGHYGVKDKALAVLPPVVPVVSPAAGG